MAQIYKSVTELTNTMFPERRFHTKDKFGKIVLTSGGFDILHVGHVRCIKASAKLGDTLIVVVNSDEFLKRKKGYAIMPLSERMEIVSALLDDRHIVVPWEDGTQFVDGPILLLRPHIFAKGGDRSSLDNIAIEERKACHIVGCEIRLGVGGCDKPQSSSKLVEQLRNRK